MSLSGEAPQSVAHSTMPSKDRARRAQQQRDRRETQATRKSPRLAAHKKFAKEAKQLKRGQLAEDEEALAAARFKDKKRKETERAVERKQAEDRKEERFFEEERAGFEEEEACGG